MNVLQRRFSYVFYVVECLYCGTDFTGLRLSFAEHLGMRPAWQACFPKTVPHLSSLRLRGLFLNTGPTVLRMTWADPYPNARKFATKALLTLKGIWPGEEQGNEGEDGTGD